MRVRVQEVTGFNLHHFMNAEMQAGPRSKEDEETPLVSVNCGQPSAASSMLGDGPSSIRTCEEDWF